MEKKGGQKMRPIFCKSLKKHIETMSAFRLSMIFMKTKELNRFLHYVDEKKGSFRSACSGWQRVGSAAPEYFNHSLAQ
jgi:hypothetical protein